MTERSPRSGSHRNRPAPGTARAEDWTKADYEQHGAFARAGHRYVVRRRKRKIRVRAMTRGRRFVRRLMILGTWILGLIAALMVAVIVAYYAITDVPAPADLPIAQTATITYSDGTTLAKIGTVDRTIVRLDQVPANTRWAVLAAEDRNFYNESAVSIRGSVRAALSDISGGSTQGGSGITQQYVKNAYLTNAQTLSRKLKELLIAVKLSRDYSKDQILEYYLNTVYFGRGAYGIQAAAQAFFGEDVEQLTTAQGALLAGLLRAPGYYDPADNPAAARGRWAYVIDGMVKTGHLSVAQEQALAFPRTKAPTSTGIGTTGWKYLLVNAVLADLGRHGITPSEVNARGMVVRTTIDRKAQAAALTAVRTTFDDLTSKQKNMKNSLVAVQPASGAVLAYYPGTGPDVKGYDGKVDFNDWAQQRANAPGSSFKPYVLATVLTQTLQHSDDQIHYAIDSDVKGNQCLTIEGTKICNDPDDADESGSSVTIGHAMRYSLNTTFDLLASQAGPDNVAAMAHSLGVAATDSAGKKTLVNSQGATTFGIGIGDYPVTTLDQASGYATLANQGVRNDAYLVAQATAADGAVVFRHRAAPEKALDPRVANDVTLTLEKVAGDADLDLDDDRMVAAKTGTEGVSGASENNSDAWMVGYTPQVSAAVWVGTGARKPIYDADGDPEYGRDLPGRTWQKFMNAYLKGTPQKKLATRQMISADGKTIPAPSSTTYAPPSDDNDEESSSSAPPSSFSRSTGFSAPPTTAAPPPTTQAPPPPTTSRAPAPSTPAAPTCGGLLQPACPSNR